jgi:transposase-like protein
MDTTAVKAALELLRKGATIKDQEQILSLRTVILDLKEEIIELRERNRELESQLKTAENLTFKEQLYYAEGDSVPYCPKCWEVNKIALHLIKVQKGVYKCPDCNNVYNLKKDVSGSLAHPIYKIYHK